MHDNQPLFRPWGTVTSQFWADPAATPQAEVPVAARIATIAALVENGSLDKAVLLAERLDIDHGAASGGAATLDTASIREVRGYLASLTGDHTTAVGWYLHTVRLRAALQGPSHPDTNAAIHRAYSLWRTAPGPEPSHRLGRDLLTTVTDIQGPDSAAAHHIRRRLTEAG